MDIVTHGLASFAVARAFFPRTGKLVVVSTVLAGIVLDVDWLSVLFGPSAFIEWHRTLLHTVVLAILLPIVLLAFLAGQAYRRGGTLLSLGTLPAGETIPDDPSARRLFLFRRFFAYTFGAPVCAGLLHIAMDACQSDGVMLLWPFSTKRFAADWLPSLDPWVLALLLAAIALPELIHLVNAEIGAKSKKPRGRTGASVGLALVLAYIGARALLHSNAVALMQSRVFHGEPARRAAAYPESLSLISWLGIAETERSLDEIEVNLLASATFDPDSSLRLYKPELSPALQAAQNTRTAKRFLAAAQIPRANVEKTDVGCVVILRDLRYAAAGETRHEIAALIELDPDNKVTSEELVWARDLRR